VTKIPIEGQCSWRERRNLPEVRAVYFLFDGSNVIYVGRTDNLRNRWKTHGLNRLISSTYPLATVGWIGGSFWRVRDLERAYVRDIKPLFNTKGVERCNLSDVLRAIRVGAERTGSQKAFAKELGVSESYISNVVKGRQSPSENLLSRLGIRKVVEFFEEGGANDN
jgi:hypothetical protein